MALSTGTTRRVGAAAAAGVAGLGFGLPCLAGLRHLATTGEVWQFLGFPTYGEGPFECVGIHTTVPLLGAFLAVCTAEVGLAIAIMRRATWAPKASRALLPFELAFWIGFSLPFGYVFGLARLLLLRRQRRSHGRPQRLGTGVTGGGDHSVDFDSSLDE